MLFGWIFHSVKVSQENEKRLDRLKELGNQMEYSYEKINGFDKELKKVSTSITQLLSDLGEVSKKMENKLKQVEHLLQGIDLTKIRETLNWINNFSQVAFQNQTGVKVAKFVIDFVVVVAGAITEIGLPAAIGIAVFVEAIFNLIGAEYNKDLLQEKTFQVLMSRFQLKKNEIKSDIILQGLRAVENQLIVFMPPFKKMLKDIEDNEDKKKYLLQYLDSLELQSKINKVINDAKKVKFEQVMGVLAQMDKNAKYQDSIQVFAYIQLLSNSQKEIQKSYQNITSKVGHITSRTEQMTKISFKGFDTPFFAQW